MKLSMITLTAAAVSALVLLAGETRSDPVEIRIGLEEAELKAFSLVDTGMSFQVMDGANGISLNRSLARRGEASLEVRLRPGETRAETKIAAIPNNTTRFAGFSVYFPEDFEPQEHWSVFAQWWQGRDVSPNIAFELDDTDSSKLAMRIISRAGTSKANQYKTHYTGDLPKGRWIDFLVEFRVDDTGGSNGLLRVWKDGEAIVDYSGRLGYTDQQSVTGFRVGMYRSARNLTDIRLFFDEIFVWNLQ